VKIEIERRGHEKKYERKKPNKRKQKITKERQNIVFKFLKRFFKLN